MKKFFISSLVILTILSSFSLAQSDFRITQEFKSRQRSFEIAVEYAKTPEELNKIKKEIDDFKNEFKGNKELLNRALYPNNFESSFTTLEKKIEYSRKKIAEIENLETKVVILKTNYDKVSEELLQLTQELNALRNNNARLMAELRAFKSGYGGSKKAIDSLNSIITQLKSGISQRDNLIKEVMDNIFMTAENKVESLNDAELKGIKSQIKNTSLIDNISNLASDNVDFLNESTFTPEDLSALRSEFNQFHDRWNHFGPKLFDIYASDDVHKDKLTQIDSLISNWDGSINSAIFRSIHDVFKTHNITIPLFTNADEFESTIIDYITAQIDGREDAQTQKDNNHIFFTQNVWTDIIKTKWLPLLLSNNSITNEQISNIEQKIEEWKQNVGGSKSLFIYAIIGVLALIIIFSLIMIYRKNKKSKNYNDDDVEKLNIKISNNYDKEVFDDFHDDNPSDKN